MTRQLRVLLHYDNTGHLEPVVRERCPAVDLHVCNSYDALAGALAQFAPEVHCCIKFENKPYPRDVLMACPSVRWVCVGGVGVDHLVPWDSERLTVTNGAGVSSEVIAWYALGAMVAITMRFTHFIRAQAEHRWQCEYVGNMSGRTVTVVGLGHTGQAIARIASGAGLRVVGTRAHPAPTCGVERVYAPGELHTALAEGDFVVVCVPLLASTINLIDEAAVRAMKPGAVLVDVSRGGVVDARALTDALRSGHLGGAALDVFDPEPMPSDHPLWDMDNVLISSHSSAVDPDWETRTIHMLCDNIERYLEGVPLENIVDPRRGY